MRLIIPLLYLFFLTALYAEKIVHYEVNITLESSGEFVVTETILYDFESQQKHGIYRIIPTTAYSWGDVGGTKWGMRFDVGLNTFQVHLDGHTVAWEKTKTKFSGQDAIMVKIGSKRQTVSGKRRYTIRYHCSNGIMPASSEVAQDMLYWNPVGEAWRVPILQTEVNLFLPPKLSQARVRVSQPKTYTWMTPHHLHIANHPSDTPLQVVFARGVLLQNGSHKIAQAKEIEKREKAQEAARKMAYRMELLNHKLAKEHKKARRATFGTISWVLFVILLAVVWLKREAWGLRGDSKSVVVRYEPPPHLSVRQAGLLFDKMSDNQESTYAAIMELAYMGYLRIEVQDDEVTLHSLPKNRDKLTLDQQKLLEGLFVNGTPLQPKQLTPSQSSSIFKKLSKIHDDLYLWAKREGYTVENFKRVRGKWVKLISFVLLPLAIVSMVIAMNTDYEGEEVGYIYLCLFVALLPLVVTSFFTSSVKARILALLSGVGVWVALMHWGLFPRQSEMGMWDVLNSYITVTLLLCVLPLLLLRRVGRYTAKGEAVVRELKGLEHFIASVKEDEIRRRLKEDPHFLDRLLPYAIRFGQVKHWLRLYDVAGTPQVGKQHTMVLKLLTHSPMLQSQSSSTGGMYGGIGGSSGYSSGSGGGFSGGAGGGGGGSW